MRLTSRFAILGLALIMTAPAVFSQSKLERAKRKFEQLAFMDAIELFKRVLLEKDEPQAIMGLADCYRLINDPENAEVWYERTLNYYSNDPLNLLYYAQALHQNGKYDEARKWYKKFDEAAVNDSRGKRGVEACDMARKLLSRPPLFMISNLPFNSSNADFGPAFFEDGIAFSSDRAAPNKTEMIFRWTGRPYLDVYTSTRRLDARWSDPERLKGSANTLYHDGPVSFSSDFKELYFTRNNIDPGLFGGKLHKAADNVVKLKIMSAWWDDVRKEWGPPQEFPYNFKEQSLAHPSLATDGKTLYFCSDMPGGYGGLDIWVSTFEGGFWTRPENLGEIINTEGDEMFPFIAPDSTLFFASNSHPGLGGLDIFKAYPNKESGGFHRIWNLGPPINSSRDDHGLILDKLFNGFMTSNKGDGRGGDDIYSAKADGIFLDVLVVDKHTGVPLRDVQMTLTAENKTLASELSDAGGRFMWAIKPENSFALIAKRVDYHEVRTDFDTRGALMGSTKYIRVEMESSLNVQLVGIVIEKTTKLPISEATATLTNYLTGAKESQVTGFDGTFNFKLYPGVDYHLIGTKPEYVHHEMVFEMTEEEMRKREVRKKLELQGISPIVFMEFSNVYFDYDKFDIREDASADLEKMLRILTLSDELRVEIGAHTDARGSSKYNESLSQRRAQAVVNYMIAKGIDGSRLVAKGYGEYMLKNKCADGVKCSEYEHQRNRRVEFSVIDENNNVLSRSQERYVDGKGQKPGKPESKSPDKKDSGTWKEVEIIRPGG